MSPLMLLCVLALGILVGAAAVWPFRVKPSALFRGWRKPAPDPALVEGHRPPDTHALGCQLLGLVRQSVDAQGVALLRKYADGIRSIMASPGIPFTTEEVMPLKQGLVGLAGEGEQEIHAESVHGETLGYLVPQPAPVTIAFFPVIHRGETWGILAVHREEGRPFTPDEISLLRRCARIVMGWQATASHVTRLEASRRQEERVIRGVKAMLHEAAPEKVAEVLLESLSDVLPSLYGFVVLMEEGSERPRVVSLNFRAPTEPQALLGSWTHWMHTRGEEPLYLEGTVGKNTAMPILWEGEPFPQNRVTFLYPFYTSGPRFGVAGLVGRAENPFEEADRITAEILLAQATSVLEVCLQRDAQARLAARDGLTGLYNRRYFDETLEKELMKAERNQAFCSLILLDIDHFKNLNDTHGHDAGDLVLRELAGRMMGAVRAIDDCCRYGGEEFAVILPACDLKEAAWVAERVRQIIASEPFVLPDGTPAPVTASLGVSAYPAPSVTTTGIAKSADQALYRAKKMGRNQVELARK